MTTEIPIVILQRKQNWYWAGIIFTIAMTAFGIFGVLLPVFITGDFNAVWPADKRTGRNTGIFFTFLFWMLILPAMFRCLYVGDFLFFNNRLEVHTYLFNHNRIYYYQDISVNQHGSYRITIHQRNLPGWGHPLKQLKALYIDGTTLALSTRGYIDPSKLPAALNILKKTTEYNLKRLS